MPINHLDLDQFKDYFRKKFDVNLDIVVNKIIFNNKKYEISNYSIFNSKEKIGSIYVNTGYDVNNLGIDSVSEYIKIDFDVPIKLNDNSKIPKNRIEIIRGMVNHESYYKLYPFPYTNLPVPDKLKIPLPYKNRFINALDFLM